MRSYMVKSHQSYHKNFINIWNCIFNLILLFHLFICFAFKTYVSVNCSFIHDNAVSLRYRNCAITNTPSCWMHFREFINERYTILIKKNTISFLNHSTFNRHCTQSTLFFMIIFYYLNVAASLKNRISLSFSLPPPSLPPSLPPFPLSFSSVYI